MDEPLDFELELLRPSPAPAKNKRKKVIGLDDLVVDFYKEKKERLKKETKRPKANKIYNSDEEQDEREAAFSKCVDEYEQYEKQLCDIGDEAEISSWGLQVFGNQNVLPSLTFPETESCLLLKSFVGRHLDSLVELNAERGGCFLEGLLADGWLSKLVHVRGQVEKSIATWTFHLMLYSSDEMLSASACGFWSAILTLKNEGNSSCIKIDWLPSYSELRGALQVYGFLMFPPKKYVPNMEMGSEGSSCLGPPQNIRAWIKFVAACSGVRNLYSLFSTSEAEDLVVWVICLLLDRQLLGLSMILYECMLSLISSFTNDEWEKSCERIARSLACRIPIDINCLRVAESISGADERSKHLRRAVAFQNLLICFEDEVCLDQSRLILVYQPTTREHHIMADSYSHHYSFLCIIMELMTPVLEVVANSFSQVPNEEGVLQFLLSINVKDKNCDLFKAYIYLVLTENWLLFNPMLEERPIVKEMWGLYLRNFSCQISSTDLRSYASKVRSKAAYLLQGIADK